MERLMVALGALFVFTFGWVPPEAIAWLQSRRLGSDPPTEGGRRMAVPASGRRGYMRRKIHRGRRSRSGGA